VGKGATVTITVCTHPQRCADTDTAYANVCGQLADAWREVERLKAALVQAQAEAREWRDAYQGAVESAAFHLAGFEQEARKAVRV